MAGPETLNGVALLVQIGDGEVSEVFAADCLINAERGIQFTTETNEVIVPDCTTPTDPAWKDTFKDGLSASISGSGLLHTTNAYSLWYAWLISADPTNVRVNLSGKITAEGGGYWEGAFHLTSFSISGERNGYSTAEISMVSHGALTWTAA